MSKWKLIEQAADPHWKGNRSHIPALVDEALWELHQPAFRPNENEAFWLSEKGQILASALYLAYRDELIAPVDAGRLIYGDTPHASKYAVDLARSGKLRAIPRPEWTKDISAESHRRTRGHGRKVFWMARRGEAEAFAQERNLQFA